MEGTHGTGLRAAVQAAQNSPHGIPGKVAVVGFSLGGGEALAYATRWPDLVATIVVWYPLTRIIQDPAEFAAGIRVPVLMFAGEDDTYKDCCLIEKARAIAAAAMLQTASLQLVTYPGAGHDFTFPGDSYNAAADADSWQRATARLAQTLGH
jgi:dienelactone hydrolase